MRSRLLKPGFFENEELPRLRDPDKGRLLFQGTWLLADRMGRLEDRPERIKAKIFPYENDVDVDALLNDLHGPFIRRYVGPDGKRYIQILKFLKHQSPHHREPESVIPPPDHAEELSKNTKPRHGRGKVQAEPQPGLADPVPVPVTDPVAVQDQVQEQPPAAAHSDEEEREPAPDPAFRQYVDIASAAIQELAFDSKHFDKGDAAERFKQKCAKQDKPYDADITQRAIDAAWYSREKKRLQMESLFRGQNPSEDARHAPDRTPPATRSTDWWSHIAQPPGSTDAAERADARIRTNRERNKR